MLDPTTALAHFGGPHLSIITHKELQTRTRHTITNAQTFQYFQGLLVDQQCFPVFFGLKTRSLYSCNLHIDLAAVLQGVVHGSSKAYLVQAPRL